MPELPEAENICRALRRTLVGETVCKVEVFTPAMREPLMPLLTADLPGKTVVQLRRRGRYVIMDLADGRALLMHFGMSGVVRVERADVPRRRHEHVFLHFESGKVFRFECPRRFSLLKVVKPLSPGGEVPELSHLGAEPLSEDFSGEFLFRASRKCKAPAKVFLMENAVVTGIGNIYANETLFASGVRPSRRAEKLTRRECALLVRNAKDILTRAIDAGGSSISDFLNVDGSEGKFARELRIYGKEGEHCPLCGAEIKRIILGGRSSFYCPKCQK